MHKIEQPKTGLTFNLLKRAVKLLNLNENNIDDQKLNKYLQKRFLANSKKFITPRLLKLKCNMTNFYFEDIMRVYVLNEKAVNENTIMFFHGGSYTHQPTRFHFEFADYIAHKTNSRLIFPIYPKAPNYTCDTCFDILFSLKKYMLSSTDNFVLMGDSAGGGMALAFNTYLHEKKQSYAKKIVLISPWLDATLKNSMVNEYTKIDPLLSRKMLQKIAIAWAGNRDTKHYKLSPINSKFMSDVKTQIYVGSEEIFLPDCRLLKEKLVADNCYVDYIEYKKFTHDFVLYPLKETERAKKDIVNFIKGKNK